MKKSIRGVALWPPSLRRKYGVLPLRLVATVNSDFLSDFFNVTVDSEFKILLGDVFWQQCVHTLAMYQNVFFKKYVAKTTLF